MYQTILWQKICVKKLLKKANACWRMFLIILRHRRCTIGCWKNSFLTTWYAKIKNILIKEYVKFDKKEITIKAFTLLHIDILTIDVNKVVVSDKMTRNNGKDCRYIVGYQVDGALITLFIKNPENMFSYGVSQYDKNSACTMLFNVAEEEAWKTQY